MSLNDALNRLRGRAKIAIASDAQYDEFPVVTNEADALALIALCDRQEDLISAIELATDLASQEWQEADGKRRGATDNSGKRLWFISDDVMRDLRATIQVQS